MAAVGESSKADGPKRSRFIVGWARIVVCRAIVPEEARRKDRALRGLRRLVDALILLIIRLY